MAANKCVMWRNGCRLFVLVKLERGAHKEYPDCFGRTPKPLVTGATDGGMTSARVGVRRDNYSLPMAEPDAGICSHAHPDQKRINCWIVSSLYLKRKKIAAQSFHLSKKAD